MPANAAKRAGGEFAFIRVDSRLPVARHQGIGLNGPWSSTN